MKHIAFILILFLSFCSMAQTVGGEVYVGTGTNEGASVVSGQTVDNITSTSFRVTWNVSPEATGQVEIYETANPGTLYYTALESNFLPLHIQTVGGSNPFALTPGTSYTFRVIGENASAQSYQGAWTEVVTLSDTPVATITATDPNATEESTTTGTYTVSLSSASVGTTTVNYTVSGTATSGSDFTALSGSVNITNGNSSATITLTPIDDAVPDEGNETVIVTLASGTGYTVGGPSIATVTIADNDGAPTPTASIVATDNTATEAGTTTGQYTVTLSSASVGTTTVNFTVSGTATSVTDYASIGTSVAITDGNTSATITVTPVDDATVEAAETVIVTLAPGTGYTVGSPDNATVTIISDDTSGGSYVASVSATDSLATEASLTTGTFSISLDAVNSGSTITVNYHAEGRALEGTDYSAFSGTVDIPNASQSATVTLTPLQDIEIEGPESVYIVLDVGTGYTVGKYDRAVAMIDDNDNENLPSVAGTSTITNATDFQNAANAGTTATVTGSFDATGLTAASGMVLVAGGGVISGTNINLNGSAWAASTTAQIFDEGATFTSIYDKSRTDPRVFGAVINDATADDDAIDATINNCAYMTSTNTGVYIKNRRSVISRSGTLDWDMNGAVIRTTSASGFDNTVTVYYVFDITNLNTRMYDGEFDGTNTYGRALRFNGQQHVFLDNLNIHDWYSPVTAEAAGIRLDIYPVTYGPLLFEIYNSTIDNINAENDFIANNSPGGISKGIQIYNRQTGTGDLYFQGNTITDIDGDDAEAVLVSPAGASYTNNTHFWFQDEVYKFAKRRQMKITMSNVHLKDSYFQTPGVAQEFSGQAATAIHVFSTSAGNPLLNFDMVNCDIISTGVHTQIGFSLTDVKDAYVDNNRINFNSFSNYAGISFGTGVSGYTGHLENVHIQNNTLTNCIVQISSLFDPVGGALQFINNPITIDLSSGNPGANIAVLRVLGNVNHSNFTFSNTVNLTGQNSLFTGILQKQAGATTNFTFEDFTVTYANSNTVYPFGYIGTPNGASAIFDATNSITNVTIVGDTGTNAIGVRTGGSATPVITNSVGDGATAITVQ